MSDAAAWPVDLIPAEEGGFIINFPDLPNGWSQGETREEALAQADDLLDEMILGRMVAIVTTEFCIYTEGLPMLR